MELKNTRLQYRQTKTSTTKQLAGLRGRAPLTTQQAAFEINPNDPLRRPKTQSALRTKSLSPTRAFDRASMSALRSTSSKNVPTRQRLASGVMQTLQNPPVEVLPVRGRRKSVLDEPSNRRFSLNPLQGVLVKRLHQRGESTSITSPSLPDVEPIRVKKSFADPETDPNISGPISSNLVGPNQIPEPKTKGQTSADIAEQYQKSKGDLSSSPKKPLGQSHSRGGLLRKQKSMNKDDLSTHTTVPMQAEQEVSGYQRGGSDETFLRGTLLDNSERMMSQETNNQIGGHSQGSPAYKLSCFGGIGQGKSAHPPGLNGEVKPCDLDMLGVLDETGEIMIPWKQDLRCDEDLYTPMWCRGQNDKKEGTCDMCEGGAWFRLKNSAYWYHKQYFHGVSSTTGHYFYPPKEIKRGFSKANRQQILRMCHECEEWVGFSSIIGTPTVKKNQHPHPHQHRLNTRTELGLDQEDTPCAPGQSEGLESDNASPGSSSSSSKVPTLWYKHNCYAQGAKKRGYDLRCSKSAWVFSRAKPLTELNQTGSTSNSQPGSKFSLGVPKQFTSRF